MTGLDSTDDLLARYRATGDPSVLGDLFDRAGPSLFRVACALVGDRARAEDVLQETFLVLLQDVERYDPARSADAWMLGILKRQAATSRRRFDRRPDVHRVRTPDAVPVPEEIAATREEREQLLRALDDLPEPYRGVALLRWRHGLEPAEIAAVRGQAPGTVWSLLSRARKRLVRVLVAAPAVLLGLRSERGLAAVREVVVEKAGVAAGVRVGTGAAALAGGVIGGIAMKTKIGVAALVVLVIALLVGSGAFERRVPATPDDVLELARSGASELDQSPRRAGADPVDGNLPGTASSGEPDRERDLFGVVVDEQGTPVSGARLSTSTLLLGGLHTLAHGIAKQRSDGRVTTSSADGTFRMRLAPGEQVHLRVEHPDFPSQVLASCSAGGRVHVVLAAGAIVDVRVIGEGGAPLPGAAVRLYDTPWPGRPANEVRAVSDAEGRASLRGFSSGPASLEVRGPSGVAAPLVGLRLPGSGRLEREVVVPTGRVLRGRVVDEASGDPVVDAELAVGWAGPTSVRTGEDGSFEMPGWRDEPYATLRVWAAGYVTRRLEHPIGDVGTIELTRGDWVTGRIVSADGAPVSGARVVVEGKSGSGPNLVFDATHGVSATDGRFAITGVARQFGHTVIVTASGHGRIALDIAPSDPPGAIALGDLVLPPPRRIAGRVLDPDGRPAPFALVTLTGANDDRARLLEGDVSGPVQVVATRATDDLGRFRFDDLAPGTYRVEHGTSAEDVVLDGADRTGIVLEAPRRPADDRPTSSLSFLVVDADDAPVVGAEIDVIAGARTHMVLTDGSGRATLDGLDVAPLRPRVRGPGGRDEFLPHRVAAVVPAAQEVRVQLRRAGVLRGRIVDAAGAPLARRAVRARDRRSEEELLARSTEDGTFTIAAEHGRTYDLELLGDREADLADGTRVYVPTPERGTVIGVTAPRSDVVIRALLPDELRSVVVRVVDAAGRGVEGAVVTAKGKARAETDSTGLARIALPGDTAVDVTVVPPDDATMLLPARTSIAVLDEEARVELSRGVILEGRVLDASGRSVPDVDVAAVDRQSGLPPTMAKTDAEGRFRLVVAPDVPLHVVSIWTDAEGETRGAEQRDVVAGQGEIVLR